MNSIFLSEAGKASGVLASSREESKFNHYKYQIQNDWFRVSLFSLETSIGLANEALKFARESAMYLADFPQYFQEKEQATTSEDNSRTPMEQHEHEWLQSQESSYETKNDHKDPTDSSETT